MWRIPRRVLETSGAHAAEQRGDYTCRQPGLSLTELGLSLTGTGRCSRMLARTATIQNHAAAHDLSSAVPAGWTATRVGDKGLLQRPVHAKQGCLLRALQGA